LVLSKDCKREILQDLIKKLKESKGVVLTDYKGMNVYQISSLRNELKEKKVEFKVIKNTLLEKASEELNVKDLTNDLIGCTAISPEKIMEIASLPSKDVLIAQMINGVKSPLYSLVFVLQGPLKGLIYTLEAVKKQKEAKVS
jgi:large subunit ribosomal protein L10